MVLNLMFVLGDLFFFGVIYIDGVLLIVWLSIVIGIDILIVKYLLKIFGLKFECVIEMMKCGVGCNEIFVEIGNMVVVNDVSLNVCVGEIFVIMGLLGFGKLMFVWLLNCLIELIFG